MDANDIPIATLPETNIASENWWLDDDISFWDGLFSGAMLVSGRVYTCNCMHECM